MKKVWLVSADWSLEKRLRWMTGLPPSSKAMPSWTASIKTLGDSDDFITSSATRSDAPSRSKYTVH